MIILINWLRTIKRLGQLDGSASRYKVKRMNIHSVCERGGFHEKTIFFEHVDPNNIYKVTIPPDAGVVTLIIKETDHKISVEVESVEKKENQPA